MIDISNETMSHWPTPANIFTIYDILTRLGVTANYTGFQQSAYAVYLCIQDPDKLALVSKWLYPEVAKRYRTTGIAVERNIRTVSRQAWETNPALLCELAGCAQDKKPSAAQFLAILTFYFLRNPYAA